MPKPNHNTTRGRSSTIGRGHEWPLCLAALLMLGACAKGITDTAEDDSGGPSGTGGSGGVGQTASSSAGNGGGPSSGGAGGVGPVGSGGDASTTSSSATGGGMGPRPPVAGELVITEIMPNPDATSDADGEWLEIANVSSDELALDGCRVIDLNVMPDEGLFPASSVIAPGARAVLAKTASAAQNGGVNGVVMAFGADFTLANSDDEIILECGGVTIDQVNYDGSFQYGVGIAAQLASNMITANANDVAANWCAATTAYGAGDLGTPGAAGSACP